MGNNANGGSLMASNPIKTAPPPIPKAEVIKEVIILAKLRNKKVNSVRSDGISNILNSLPHAEEGQNNEAFLQLNEH